MSTYPATPKLPVFKGMTPEQNEMWLRAHNWAYASIVDCIRRLEINPAPVPSDFNIWFEWFNSHGDPGWPAHYAARRETVLTSFRKMASHMSEVAVTYEKCFDDVKCKRTTFIDKLFSQRDAFVEITKNTSSIDRTICLCGLANPVHCIMQTAAARLSVSGRRYARRGQL